MYWHFFALISLLAVSASAAPTCKEGEKVEKESVWYECRDGQLVAKGCLSSNGDRLKLQDVYDSNQVRFRCQLDSSGNPSLVGKSCVRDGVEHQPGEKWDDSKYVYTCKKDGDKLTIQATGCIRNGQKLDVGDRTTFNDVVYECNKEASSDVPVMAAWGCADKFGTSHKAGTEFDIDPYWYTCQNKNGVVTLELSGCVNAGVRVRNGDRFSKENVVFECQAIEGGGNLKVVGCIQEEPTTGMKIERRVGCYWAEGKAPYQVTMTCIPDQEAKVARATPLHCDYRMPGSGTTYSIDMGCYRLFDDVAVGCLVDTRNLKVTAVPIQVNEKHEPVSVPNGLKFC